MSLRTSPTLLGTFIRAGLICFAGSGRSCLAHGLGETPDTIAWVPQTGGDTSVYTQGIFLESYDATSFVFVNSYAGVVRAQLRAAVEHSQIQ